MFVLIVAVQLPRFALAVAAGEGPRAALLRGPAALAPAPGGSAQIGEVSAAAEAFGVRAGMALGEAMARCPAIALVPPDPAGVAERWEELLARIEGVGAAVAPQRPGLVCFDARGLMGLHGGLERILTATARALRRPARLAAAPTAFCAVAAATRARGGRGRAEVVPGGEAEARAYLAPLEVALLELREDVAAVAVTLERLGIATLGALAALPRAAVADRLGHPGLRAYDLAHGRDEPLHPRPPLTRVRESLELPEAAGGPALEHALGLLIDRLMSRRERRGRTLRAVALSGALVEGGTWRDRVVFRQPLADPERMALALGQRLALLPAPAFSLALAIEAFGPPAGDQRPLIGADAEDRAARLRDAVRQARALAGVDAALRVVLVDPDSRVPERRAMLAPFESGEGPRPNGRPR